MSSLSGNIAARTLVTNHHSQATNSATTVVTPGANTNGIRIDRINFGDLGSGGTAAVMSKTSAPSGVNDTAARILGRANASASTNAPAPAISPEPFIVPPGEGLYLFASIANSIYVSIDYEVL